MATVKKMLGMGSKKDESSTKKEKKKSKKDTKKLKKDTKSVPSSEQIFAHVDPSTTQQPTQEVITEEGPALRARVLYDYAPHQDDEIQLRAGDIMLVYEQDESGWWTGENNGNYGLFPRLYVELIDEKSDRAEEASEIIESPALVNLAKQAGTVNPIMAKAISAPPPSAPVEQNVAHSENSISSPSSSLNPSPIPAHAASPNLAAPAHHSTSLSPTYSAASLSSQQSGNVALMLTGATGSPRSAGTSPRASRKLERSEKSERRSELRQQIATLKKDLDEERSLREKSESQISDLTGILNTVIKGKKSEVEMLNQRVRNAETERDDLEIQFETLKKQMQIQAHALAQLQQHQQQAQHQQSQSHQQNPPNQPHPQQPSNPSPRRTVPIESYQELKDLYTKILEEHSTSQKKHNQDLADLKATYEKQVKPEDRATAVDSTAIESELKELRQQLAESGEVKVQLESQLRERSITQQANEQLAKEHQMQVLTLQNEVESLKKIVESFSKENSTLQQANRDLLVSNEGLSQRITLSEQEKQSTTLALQKVREEIEQKKPQSQAPSPMISASTSATPAESETTAIIEGLKKQLEDSSLIFTQELMNMKQKLADATKSSSSTSKEILLEREISQLKRKLDTEASEREKLTKALIEAGGNIRNRSLDPNQHTPSQSPISPRTTQHSQSLTSQSSVKQPQSTEPLALSTKPVIIKPQSTARPPPTGPRPQHLKAAPRSSSRAQLIVKPDVASSQQPATDGQQNAAANQVADLQQPATQQAASQTLVDQQASVQQPAAQQPAPQPTDNQQHDANQQQPGNKQQVPKLTTSQIVDAGPPPRSPKSPKEAIYRVTGGDLASARIVVERPRASGVFPLENQPQEEITAEVIQEGENYWFMHDEKI